MFIDDHAPQFYLDYASMVVTVYYEDGSTFKAPIFNKRIKHLLAYYEVEFE